MSVGFQVVGVEPADEIDPDRLFDVLETASARRILASMDDGPVTAGELADRSGVANSTLYRQLHELVDANLVEKSTRLDARGHHASQYERTVSEVSISLDGAAGMRVSLR